jgi:hypothetical protein
MPSSSTLRQRCRSLHDQLKAIAQLHLSALKCAAHFGLALMPMIACAEPASPAYAMTERMPDTTMTRSSVKGVRLGRLNVAFETMPLSQLIARAGVGGIAHQGDAGKSTYWVCFFVQLPAPQRVWFTAGELDGSEPFISGVKAVILPPAAKATKDCPSLPADLQPVSLSSGVWLGSSEADVLKIFGSAAASDDGWRTHVSAVKDRGADQSKQESFDRTISVYVRLRHGRVEGIVATQTAANQR